MSQHFQFHLVLNKWNFPLPRYVCSAHGRLYKCWTTNKSFRPLTGFVCFALLENSFDGSTPIRFPSPYGVCMFCTELASGIDSMILSFRPLTGFVCFALRSHKSEDCCWNSFRPLTGFVCFARNERWMYLEYYHVSVPLRGLYVLHIC